MLILNSRFKFGDEINTAKVIDITDKNKVRVNGTEFFERVKLTEDDLRNLNLPFETSDKYCWQNSELLGSGKYKVTYNQADYFMTYLDELDLFNAVVKKLSMQERKNAILEVFQVLKISPVGFYVSL